MLHCALSGEVVSNDAVVSKKSGHVFERRLLEQYLNQHERQCPITGELLDLEQDVVALVLTSNNNNSSHSGPPRPVNTTSVPACLQVLQNEWDALMLETYSLKKQLEATRQELSQTLYQHDAACRVIARLLKQQQSLSSEPQENHPKPGQDDDKDKDNDANKDPGLGPDRVAKLEALGQSLAAARQAQQRVPTSMMVSPESIARMRMQSSHTPHKSNKPGVLCVALHPKDLNLVVTGGVDGQAKIFHRTQQKVIGTLSGHTKDVNDVLCHPEASDVFVTASSDRTVKIWHTNAKKRYHAIATIQAHEQSVTGLSLHPSGDWISSCGQDAMWGCFDLRTGDTLYTVPSSLSSSSSSSSLSSSYTCVEYHPDGMILATGSSAQGIQIWDVKSTKNVASFDGHAGIVSDVSFSNNGYYMMSAGQDDGTMRLWDLRKLSTVVTITMDDPATGASAASASASVSAEAAPQDTRMMIHAISFDTSGKYVGVATGSKVVMYHEHAKKKWHVVQEWTEHTAPVTDVAMAHDGSFLTSTSMDRTLKFYYEDQDEH